MTAYTWPTKDNKCDPNVRVSFIWRWRVSRVGVDGAGRGGGVVKGIGGVQNSYTVAQALSD